MPSPIGHALGGIALAWAVAPRRTVTTAVGLAAVALAPDLDLLIGDHRGISHSIGAAVVAGVVASALWASAFASSALRRDTLRVALSVTLAWSSHIFLDWLSNDTRPPLGVMAFWPITTDYYKAAIEIFPPVSRRWGDTRFWSHNVRAAFVELALLGPIAWAAITTFRGRRTRT